MGPIFRIIKFTRTFWRWYLFMGTFVIVISLLSLATPVLSKLITDIIVAKVQGKSADITRIFILLGLIIGVDVFTTILTAVSQWIGDILTVRLNTDLSKRFYEHVLRLHIGYFDNELTGKIVTKMYRGIQSITDFIQNMLNNFLPFFLSAFVTILLLAHYSLAIAALLAVLFPIYILISHRSSMAWRGYENQKNAINDAAQGRVFESFTGIRIVKSFVATGHELAQFINSRRNIEKLAIQQTKEWHWYDFLRRLILNIIFFCIYAYIVYWTFATRYTIGEMTLMLQLVTQARFPLFAMSFILGQIQQASSGSKDYFGIMETHSLISDRPNASPLTMSTVKKSLITFDKVRFGYEKEKNVLEGISFTIRSGEKFALVGESGQGKSTIANLLLRFYEPQAGVISINGQDISNVTQQSLHQQIAIVFQESLLFSGTIEENILYGKPGASKDEVIAAAKAANAHEFIEKLPNGYASTIGERGVKLSGGQKQRIAIARAILKDAPIIILDEATSSLDSRSELLVQQGLDHLLHNRTSIIIAHRLSTIANADRILVISEGKVAQYGTPHELLQDKKGIYAQLVSLQTKLLSTPSVRKQKLKAFDLVS